MPCGVQHGSQDASKISINCSMLCYAYDYDLTSVIFYGEICTLQFCLRSAKAATVDSKGDEQLAAEPDLIWRRWRLEEKCLDVAPISELISHFFMVLVEQMFALLRGNIKLLYCSRF